MPIYEYACKTCNRMSTILVMKRDAQEGLQCRHCGSDQLHRVMSRFAVHQTEASRIQALDSSSRQDESYYKDDRNIGLWAKKRMGELGVDIGNSLDEKIEKARTSSLDDLLDKKE